jgi:hypothetical protein
VYSHRVQRVETPENWRKVIKDIVARCKKHTNNKWVDAAGNKFVIFNDPVNHVALGLTNYLDVITRPMDLTTIEKGIMSEAEYAIAKDGVEDLMLVFENGMTYNPSGFFHTAGKSL